MRDLLYAVKDCFRRRRLDCSGQALVEFAVPACMLIVLVFGLIDFARVIYDKQVMINISREGSNLAARGAGSTIGEALANAANAVVASASPLTSNNVKVIISAVVFKNGSYTVTSQASAGKLSGAGIASKLPGIIPTTSTRIPQPNRTLYVTEVFHSFTPKTPLWKLLRLTAPTALYDVAFF